MFYQCPKCKKVWQYTIGKCPECFLGLERLPSEKIKVIGVSKVNIPTIFHQKVPYFVLLLEDEKENKWVQKSTKEYKIGDVIEYKSSEGKNTVALWRIKYDILEAIEKVVELIGGININQKPSPAKQGEAGDEAKPQRPSTILILPTLISPKHSYFAENTSPQFLESLIKYLLKNGVEAKNIKVAGQSPVSERSSVLDRSRIKTKFLVRGFDEIPIEACAKKSGLLDVCLKNKVQMLDLAKAGFIKKDGLEISEEVFTSDLIINLPILKLDTNLGVRGATDNTLKFLRKESYLSLQRLSNLEGIMERIQKLLPDHLTIAEGNYVQTASGFVAFLGVVLASFNPFNLDRIFAEICEIESLPEWLKKVKIESIPVVGRKIAELQYNPEI